MNLLSLNKILDKKLDSINSRLNRLERTQNSEEILDENEKFQLSSALVNNTNLQQIKQEQKQKEEENQKEEKTKQTYQFLSVKYTIVNYIGVQLLHKIFDFLPLEDLVKMKQINRNWKTNILPLYMKIKVNTTRTQIKKIESQLKKQIITQQAAFDSNILKYNSVFEDNLDYILSQKKTKIKTIQQTIKQNYKENSQKTEPLDKIQKLKQYYKYKQSGNQQNQKELSKSLNNHFRHFPSLKKYVKDYYNYQFTYELDLSVIIYQFLHKSTCQSKKQNIKFQYLEAKLKFPDLIKQLSQYILKFASGNIDMLKQDMTWLNMFATKMKGFSTDEYYMINGSQKYQKLSTVHYLLYAFGKIIQYLTLNEKKIEENYHRMTLLLKKQSLETELNQLYTLLQMVTKPVFYIAQQSKIVKEEIKNNIMSDIFQFFTPKELLSFRLVNQNWKSYICNFFCVKLDYFSFQSKMTQEKIEKMDEEYDNLRILNKIEEIRNQKGNIKAFQQFAKSPLLESNRQSPYIKLLLQGHQAWKLQQASPNIQNYDQCKQYIYSLHQWFYCKSYENTFSQYTDVLRPEILYTYKINLSHKNKAWSFVMKNILTKFDKDKLYQIDEGVENQENQNRSTEYESMCPEEQLLQLKPLVYFYEFLTIMNGIKNGHFDLNVMKYGYNLITQKQKQEEEISKFYKLKNLQQYKQLQKDEKKQKKILTVKI